MKTKQLILTIILVMTTLLNYAQTYDLLADGQVQPLRYIAHYTTSAEDQTERIASMYFARKENNLIECVIRFKESNNTNYWFFTLKDTQMQNNVVTGNLHPNISHEVNDWAYIDDNARGTFTSDRNTGIETLDFYHHVYHNEYHYVISWKITK
jgi:hypothetical protein